MLQDELEQANLEGNNHHIESNEVNEIKETNSVEATEEARKQEADIEACYSVMLQKPQEIIEVDYREADEEIASPNEAEILEEKEDVSLEDDHSKISLKDKLKEKRKEVKEKKLTEKEMSFRDYKERYQNKERGFFSRWGIRLGKIILAIMLLPFIAIVAAAAFAVILGFLVTIIGSFGTGIIVIGVISFFATQLSGSVIALGISSSITVMAFGGMISIVFAMLIKAITNGIKQMTVKRKACHNKRNGGKLHGNISRNGFCCKSGWPRSCSLVLGSLRKVLR